VYKGIEASNCTAMAIHCQHADDEAFALVHTLCPVTCGSCDTWTEPASAVDAAGTATFFGEQLPYLDFESLVMADDDVPFYPVLDDQFGVCYQFRPSRDLTDKDLGGVGSVDTVGAYAPHRVTLRTFVNKANYLPTSEFEGTIITIGGAKDLMKVGGRTITVPPGFYAAVGVREVKIERLPAPYSNCKPGGNTKEVCEFEATFKYQMTECNCRNIYQEDYLINSLPAGTAFHALPECTTAEQWECIHQANDFAKANLKTISSGACEAQPCSEKKYEVKLLGLLPVAKGFKDFEQERLKAKNAEYGIALNSGALPDSSIVEEGSKVTIYFDDLKVVEYIDSAEYTVESFIAGIGGFFGLFLGFSLFSFVEFFEYLVVVGLNFHSSCQPKAHLSN
jgi:hypothetical protein